MQYYIQRNGQQLGPFTEAEVKAQLAAGSLSLLDHVWWEGQANWLPLGQSPLAAMPAPGAIGSPVGPAVEQTSNLAMGSFISGIVTFVCGCPSLLCCGLFAAFNGVPALLAIVLGHLGLAEIKKQPALKGRSLALAGMIMGYVALFLGVVYIIIVLTFFGLNYDSDKFLKQLREEIKSAQNEGATSQSSNSPDDDDDSTNSAPATTNAPASGTNSPSSK